MFKRFKKWRPAKRLVFFLFSVGLGLGHHYSSKSTNKVDDMIVDHATRLLLSEAEVKEDDS